MQKYDTALRIAEEFQQITDYKERLNFWDEHPQIFGESSVILFDTVEHTYAPFNGASPEEWPNLLGSDEDRYELYWTLPSDITEFPFFMEWCIEKAKPRMGAFFTIMDEECYWKRIQKNNFPEEFLERLLAYAEELRRANSSQPPPIWGSAKVSTDDAEKNFLYYGNYEFSEGDTGGVSGTTSLLYQILQKLTTRPLWQYGTLFFKFHDGWYTAYMVKFLREQKKRLDKGEIIKFPSSGPPLATSATKTESTTSATSSAPEITVPALALMYVYLTKTRDVILKMTPAFWRKEVEGKGWRFSPGSLYNDYRMYLNDEKRLKAVVVPHIRKAIVLLTQEGFTKAVNLAETELKNIRIGPMS